MKKFRILHQDHWLVVFEKPAGIPVHPPERGGRERSRREDVLRILRTQTGRSIYPVHRLDQATAGVMMAAFDSESARKLQAQFQGGKVRKAYLTLCRGWLADQGRIDSPLTSDTDPEVLKSAVTDFETLHRFEVPHPSAGHASSRFSLLVVRPETGRWHQIRRHLKRLSHPVIGDTVHGDGVQNRIWRSLTGESRLYLLAWALCFEHPETKVAMRFTARFSGTWHRVFDRAQACPHLLDRCTSPAPD